MGSPTSTSGQRGLSDEIHLSFPVWKAPSKLTLIEWAEKFCHVAEKTSATPGKWRTNTNLHNS